MAKEAVIRIDNHIIVKSICNIYKADAMDFTTYYQYNWLSYYSNTIRRRHNLADCYIWSLKPELNYI